MFKGLMTFVLCSMLAMPVVASVANEMTTDEVAMVTCGIVLVGGLLAPKGVLGMNTYSMGFIVDKMVPTGFTPGGDDAYIKRLCARVGHLWLGSSILQTRFSQGTKAVAPFLYEDKIGKMELDFISKLLLPNALDMQISPNADLPAGFNAFQSIAILDDNCKDRMNNLGNPMVIAGSLCVVATEGDQDVSSEMTTQLRIPIGEDANGTQFLTVGFATASAQDNVYVPFVDSFGSTALAPKNNYWTGGTGGIRNAPIIVTGNATQFQLTK